MIQKKIVAFDKNNYWENFFKNNCEKKFLLINSKEKNVGNFFLKCRISIFFVRFIAWITIDKKNPPQIWIWSEAWADLLRIQ